MNDLSLHILDIVQNSISAKATLIELGVFEDLAADTLTIVIRDDGKGMTPEQVERVADPFFTSRKTRKVGLGLPLYKQNAMQAGGDVTITSEVGKGTTVTAVFGHANIDRPPLGDLANAVMLLVSANPEVDFRFTYGYNGEEYLFDTQEVKEALDGLPLSDPQVFRMVEELIRNNMEEVQGTSSATA